MDIQQTKEQVIIFGGSFNPPTLAHERIIETCLAMPGFDEVWVMPSGDRADKCLSNTKEHRLAMLETMKQQEFHNDSRLKITDFELQLPQPTQTIRTVGALALAHPDTRFWFVFGADSYASMPEWEYGTILQKQLPVMLLPRPGSELPGQSDTIKHLPSVTEAVAISSTEARAAAAEQRDLAPFVSCAVQKFITTHRLYVA